MGTVMLIANIFGFFILAVVVLQFLLARNSITADKDLIYVVMKEEQAFGRLKDKTILYVGSDKKIAFKSDFKEETDEGANPLTLQVWHEGESIITFNKIEGEWQPAYDPLEELDVRPTNAF
ncbi:hypothetical protein ACPV3A_17065 [Paenibacillus sp. Dod16]|uniref:hypothetical protein n=1 Tax=Paenibacillus sp. Dod16 TaxID=3416392 RepID=UPI003CF9A03B